MAESPLEQLSSRRMAYRSDRLSQLLPGRQTSRRVSRARVRTQAGKHLDEFPEHGYVRHCGGVFRGCQLHERQCCAVERINQTSDPVQWRRTGFLTNSDGGRRSTNLFDPCPIRSANRDMDNSWQDCRWLYDLASMPRNHRVWANMLPDDHFAHSCNPDLPGSC